MDSMDSMHRQLDLAPDSRSGALGTTPLGGAFLRCLVVFGDGAASGGANRARPRESPWKWAKPVGFPGFPWNFGVHSGNLA